MIYYQLYLAAKRESEKIRREVESCSSEMPPNVRKLLRWIDRMDPQG